MLNDTYAASRISAVSRTSAYLTIPTPRPALNPSNHRLQRRLHHRLQRRLHHRLQCQIREAPAPDDDVSVSGRPTPTSMTSSTSGDGQGRTSVAGTWSVAISGFSNSAYEPTSGPSDSAYAILPTGQRPVPAILPTGQRPVQAMSSPTPTPSQRCSLRANFQSQRFCLRANLRCQRCPTKGQMGHTRRISRPRGPNGSHPSDQPTSRAKRVTPIGSADLTTTDSSVSIVYQHLQHHQGSPQQHLHHQGSPRQHLQHHRKSSPTSASSIQKLFFFLYLVFDP